MTDQEVPQADRSTRSDSSERLAAFQSDVAELTVPTSVTRQESYLFWAGVALVVVGIVVVFAGYWGASGTAVLAEQVPYILSGGAIGLALVIVGAVLIGRYSMAKLFRYWLALLVAENRTQTNRLVDAIEQSNDQGAPR